MEKLLHKKGIVGLNESCDTPIKIFSLYLRHIGLPPWGELDELGVTQLPSEPVGDEPENLDSDEEPPITSRPGCFGRSHVRPTH
jgi:hypothetical protein